MSWPSIAKQSKYHTHCITPGACRRLRVVRAERRQKVVSIPDREDARVDRQSRRLEGVRRLSVVHTGSLLLRLQQGQARGKACLMILGRERVG